MHSALAMVKFNHVAAAGSLVKAVYQYCGHSSASATAEDLCFAHHVEAELA
jgi:hypothetical protein